MEPTKIERVFFGSTVKPHSNNTESISDFMSKVIGLILIYLGLKFTIIAIITEKLDFSICPYTTVAYYTN